MSNTSVPRCSHQRVDTERSLCEDHIVDVTFMITHADDVRAWAVRLECIQLLASLKPFRTFILADRSILLKMFLAKLFGSTYPAFHALLRQVASPLASARPGCVPGSLGRGEAGFPRSADGLQHRLARTCVTDAEERDSLRQLPPLLFE